MASSPPGTPPSKLPRFLQKQTQRDRSKSESVTVASPDQKQRKGSKFLSINRDRKASADLPSEFGVDEPPIIVEPPAPNSPGPVNIPSPRPRTRSERPVASAPETQHINLYASTSSTGTPSGSTRIGDLPTRLSGWFAHTFSSSSTDLSLPAILAQHSRGTSPSGYDSSSSHASPARKLFSGPAALLAAAKHGKDKAMLYLLDSDAVPDRCGDPIWLLGVQHPGWEGPPVDPHAPSPPTPQRKIKGRRGSWRSSSSSAASSSADGHSSPTTSSAGHGSATSGTTGTATNKGPRPPPDPGAAWPPAFYSDFTSRVWLTYRSQLPIPIRDGRLVELPPCSPPFSVSSTTLDENQSPTVGRKVWPWAGEKTWSADTGWGCMLRTGQSLLANALVGVHLGRDWRRPPHPVATPEYATYVRILTWFLDTPSPHAPFSVHRMALAGKELGTDVGQWFGPSVAAGAIKTLVSSFPESGLSVALAVDGTLYQSSVFAASHGDASRVPRRQHTASWGERPVLILLGIRLGIEGVNPIYYETIKMLYTFPQSVGIAGGRPSSSYYFVGSQADALFYLDPHNPRQAITLRPPPPREQVERFRQRKGERGGERDLALRGLGRGTAAKAGEGEEGRSSPDSSGGSRAASAVRQEKAREGREEGQDRKQSRHPQDADRDSRHKAHGLRSPSRIHQPQPSPAQLTQHRNRTGAPHPRAAPATPASPSSVKTGSSNFSYHAPTSPSPLQQQFSTSSADSRASHASRASQVSSASRTSRASQASDADADVECSVGEDEGYGEEAEYDARAPPPVYDQHRGDRYAGGGASAHVAASSSAVSALSSTDQTDLDPVQLHYINAYSAAELRTFHCDRVRKMPLSGLDPSMLIGFVCRDEADWRDFRKRVGELPKTIFSIQDEPPNWPSDLDDDMGLESISEPDPEDLELDDDDEEDDDDDDERAVVVGDDPEAEEDGDEQFFDTREAPGEGSGSGREERRGERHVHAHRLRHDLSKSTRRSTDTSEDEDPAGPVTPGPTGRFDIRVPVPARVSDGKGKGRMNDDVVRGGEVKGRGEMEGSDIEDDWIDPSLPTPTGVPTAPQVKTRDREQPPPPPPKDKERHKDRSTHSPPLSSSTSSKHGSSSTSTGKSRKSASSSSTATSGRKSSGSGQVPVPVPKVRVSHGRHHQQEPQEHYPFPVAPSDHSPDAGSSRRERERTRSRTSSADEDEDEDDDGRGEGRRRTKTQTQLSHSHSHNSQQSQHGGSQIPPSHRMHNGRARDGGRTQSGGVKAILTDS